MRRPLLSLPRFDDLLASGRLRETPLAWLEPLFARVEERWTDRMLGGSRGTEAPPYLIAVTGALRGGSWKTPLSVGLAAALAARGLAGCWVGRGFRSRPRFEGRLADARAALLAGDEAFATWRALRGSNVDVVVAHAWRRALTLAAACRPHDFVVLDGCRQQIGPGSGCSLVALDGAAAGTTVWSRSAGLPIGLGNGLSPRNRRLVPVVDVVERPTAEPLGATYDLAWDRVVSAAEASRALLVTTHARPERLLQALQRRGLAPRVHLSLSDHAGADELRRALTRLSRGADGKSLSLVLAADKAALALRSVALPAPLVLLACHVTPSPALVAALVDDARKFCR